MSKMYICFRVGVPYSCQILVKLEFSRHVLEEYFNTKFHKIRPVGTELFHVD
jgi:hypothetical protein